MDLGLSKKLATHIRFVAGEPAANKHNEGWRKAGGNQALARNLAA